jgi:uncharacterized protein
MKRSPLLLGVLFQAGLGLVGLLLIWWFDLPLAAGFEAPALAIAGAALAVVPMLLAVAWIERQAYAWVAELKQISEQLVELLFRHARPGAVVLVALLAGFGEELLFRGVLQQGLAGLIGPVAAWLLASLAFGAVHALTRAYFIIATLMGLYLGALYALTGSLLLVSLAHAGYDYLVFRRFLAERALSAPS